MRWGWQQGWQRHHCSPCRCLCTSVGMSAPAPWQLLLEGCAACPSPAPGTAASTEVSACARRACQEGEGKPAQNVQSNVCSIDLLTRCRCAVSKVAASARASPPSRLCSIRGGDTPVAVIGPGCFATQLRAGVRHPSKPPALPSLWPVELSAAGGCRLELLSAASMSPADSHDQFG